MGLNDFVCLFTKVVECVAHSKGVDGIAIFILSKMFRSHNLDWFDSFNPVAGWDNVKGFLFCFVCIDRVKLRLVPVVVIVPSKVGYFESRHGE